MGTLEINAIQNYLLEVGCKIEYPKLVNAFKKHLYNPDPQVQGKLRTQFKDYVNRLAIVSLENNMKFIILRPEYRQPPDKLDTVDSNSQDPMSPKSMRSDTGMDTTRMIPAPRQPLQQQPQPQQQQILSPQERFPEVISKPLQTIQTPIRHSKPPQSAKAPPPPPPTHQTNHAQSMNHHLVAPNRQNQNVLPLPNKPPPIAKRSQSLQRPESVHIDSASNDMPPPRPPPRRRLSTASLFEATPKPVAKKSREITDLAKKSVGKVKEHALKLNSSISSGDLNSLMPSRNSIMKENFRLSRDSSFAGSLNSVLHRTGSHVTTRSRSSNREDESDSSSLQPIDALKRKWVIEACNCNYNGLLLLLREDPKLATYKDFVNGYTALHWAAKFGNSDIIKLMAGTHRVSPDIKSSAGYTPLHIACMFQRGEIVDLLIKSYKANINTRDHSGKRPMQYWKNITSS